LDSLDEALQVSARTQAPFPLHVTGLGIFSGPSPVIYLPVTKTPAVSVLHNHLWELLGPMAASVNKNYDADVWIPHITLTHETTDTNAIFEVISRLASVPLELEILVDHLAIIYKDDSVSGIRKKYQFGAGNL
jgi:2'-5' RNA ligase